MRQRPVRLATILVTCAALTAAGAISALAVPDLNAKELTIWAVAPQQTVTKQTGEQDKYNQEHGRPAPAPELLQPTLDSSLPVYKPLGRNQLRGSYDCGASDVLAALSKDWVREFTRMYPKVTINLDPPYAGSLGALALIDGKLDCVFVSRELKPSDDVAFRAKFGYGPTSIPISGGSYRHFGFLDSMGFVVNASNPISKLSFDQLDRLLSSTHNRGGTPIRTWGDLGLTGDWKDKPIHIYGIKPWNGFEEFVRERVLDYNGNRGEWRSADTDPQVSWDTTVFKQAERVKNDPYGIAYTGVAYVDQPVKVLSLSNHDNDPAYAPTYENVASAQYPLSRLVYLNLNKTPGRSMDPVMQELIKFVISKQGQGVVGKQAVFLPLRGFQSAASAQQLTSLP
ncbi:PstS family phosphate ABC transporter substrate-binding protein [Kribbella sp. NPDC059898]|uniref:PstS family phosphate ABC transporter substrate-binding protein n=1 Tax=Kribbella sp. NPDC059898 TaxID=3346995 RepID=UPI00364E7235